MKSVHSLLSASLPLAVALLIMAVAAASNSEQVGAQPSKIDIWNQSQQIVGVAEAKDIWSKQIGTVWTNTGRAEGADLIVEDASAKNLRKICGQDCTAWSSTIGNTAGPTTITLSKDLPSELATSVIVHEMGHFFGLKHSKNCSVMREIAISPFCPIDTPRRVECRFSRKERQYLAETYQGSSPKRSFECFSKIR